VIAAPPERSTRLTDELVSRARDRFALSNASFSGDTNGAGIGAARRCL
jgi:hypothetical protein